MRTRNEKSVLFVIGSMRRGGAERVISILANNYTRKGWKVDIITLLDNKNDYLLEDSINVINLLPSKKNKIFQLQYWIRSIRNYVNENDPSRIVSFIARINIITLISCIGLNKRIIVSERNDPKSDGRSYGIKILTYLLYNYSNRIVFQTQWAKSCFPNKIQKKGIIIPNPVEVNKITSNSKRKKIVAVGRLQEQKNHKMLINSFSKISERFPEYKLYIYGEGSLRNDLINQINEMGLSKKIFLPGNIIDIHEQIADAEMFVLPSNYEGLSNALIEAMMLGIPCISTNCAGSNEIIRNYENGLLIPIGDMMALTEAIIKLINDEKLREKIRNAALNSSQMFNSQSIVNRWEEVIE